MVAQTCKYRGCRELASPKLELVLFKWDEIDTEATDYNPKAVELCAQHWARWLEFWNAKLQ